MNGVWGGDLRLLGPLNSLVYREGPAPSTRTSPNLWQVLDTMSSQGLKIKLYFNHITVSKMKKKNQTKLKRSFKLKFFLPNIYRNNWNRSWTLSKHTEIPIWILSAMGLSHFGNYSFKNSNWDFPGGPVVKNPPSNAGDVGSISGRATKPVHHNYWALKPQLESLHAATTCRNKDPVCHN